MSNGITTNKLVMNYKEIKGDLIQLAKDGHFDIICHGCNCFSVMGGLAGQIAKEFPMAEEVDKKYPMIKQLRLGNLSSVSIPPTEIDFTRRYFTIVNLYTQYLPGPNLDYEALILCLRKLQMLYRQHSFEIAPRIGLPQIGCGIAGGDWERVKAIIQKELTDVDYTVVIYEPQ